MSHNTSFYTCISHFSLWHLLSKRGKKIHEHADRSLELQENTGYSWKMTSGLVLWHSQRQHETRWGAALSNTVWDVQRDPKQPQNFLPCAWSFTFTCTHTHFLWIDFYFWKVAREAECLTGCAGQTVTHNIIKLGRNRRWVNPIHHPPSEQKGAHYPWIPPQKVRVKLSLESLTCWALQPHCTDPSQMVFPKPSLALLPNQNNWSLSFP